MTTINYFDTINTALTTYVKEAEQSTIGTKKEIDRLHTLVAKKIADPSAIQALQTEIGQLQADRGTREVEYAAYIAKKIAEYTELKTQYDTTVEQVKEGTQRTTDLVTRLNAAWEAKFLKCQGSMQALANGQ